MEQVKPGEQMPLHLANLQQREMTKRNRDEATEVAGAASTAILDKMKGMRTRTQKPLRDPVKDSVDPVAAKAVADADAVRAIENAAPAKAEAEPASKGKGKGKG